MDEPKIVTVKYTADRMKAVVALSKNAGQITLGLILRELIHKGVVHGLNTDVMNKLAANPIYDKYIEVASGSPAKPGVDGRVVILAGDDFDGEPEPNHEFTVVRKGEPVARRILPKPGVDGISVLGDPIPAAPVKDVAMNGGNGVQILPDGDPNVLTAETDGVLEVSADGLIEVQPHIEIAGDIDAASGDVEFVGYMTVRGAIRSGSAVESHYSMVVNGEVENARITCGGDLFLHSAVRGGDKAVIECRGDVYAPQLENVKLKADGSVTVEGEIVNSDISCKGAVKAAVVIGGNMSAVCGITARQAGDESGVYTVLDAGGIRGYAKERENLKGMVETQNLLMEGYVSELYSFVRDNMDEFGVITDDKTEQYESLVKNLTDSITMIRDYKESMNDIEALLDRAKDCGIIAEVLYPNVHLKLGVSEQTVKEVMRYVNLKPAGV